MKSNFNTSLEILQTAQRELLYHRLLQQLQKDFTLANIDLRIVGDMEPLQLAKILQEKIYVLLMERHQQFLNLLYIVDIAEDKIRKTRDLDAVDASSEVCFLILKREWQKVWFKHKFNS